MTDQKDDQVLQVPALRRSIPPAPVHPLAALATIVLDNLFTLPEFAGPELWIFTVPIIGGISLLTTSMVQHYLAKDGWGESIAKGLVMGVVAGVPISVTGTAVGAVLLAWAGLHEWLRLPAPQVNQESTSAPSEEILDAEVKDL